MIFGKDLLRANKEVQFIWQCGKFYASLCKESESGNLSQIRVMPFIEDMSMAYQAADLVVCRAGALTIAEICLLGKPSILIPSPNVAEDHQTKNALSLQQNAAAMTIKDDQVKDDLLPEVFKLIQDEECLIALGRNALRLGFPDAAEKLADIILQFVPSDKKNAAI
jgi:UDP-N-acetylglucosamine--N-acetylmuramyl-(pentapeptide) pyrophosphoryl-undecaprenol N-acetylglucosamine transferase